MSQDFIRVPHRERSEIVLGLHMEAIGQRNSIWVAWDSIGVPYGVHRDPPKKDSPNAEFLYFRWGTST